MIIKQKSDYEYVSDSENYIILINSTYISVYNVLCNTMKEIKIRDVKDVYVDYKDRYLYLSKFYSSNLYIYELETGDLLLKKALKRGTKIKNLLAIDDELIVCLENKKSNHKVKDIYKSNSDIKELYIFEQFMFLYHFSDNTIKNIILPNYIFEVEGPMKIKDEYLYAIQIIEQDKLNTYLYKIKKDKDEIFLIKSHSLNYDESVIYSDDMKYFVKKNYKHYRLGSIEGKNIDKINVKDFSNNEIFSKKNEKDLSLEFEICKFAKTYNNIYVVYFYWNKTIYIYEINGKLREIKVNKEIIDMFLSLKNDYITILINNNHYTVLYMYTLSKMKDNKKLIF